MPPSNHRFKNLHLTSSGTKIFTQFMMFLVVGVLPWLFPQWIYLENRTIIFFIVTCALVTSFIYEILKIYFEKRNKDTNLLLSLQLLTSVLLLTPFLHFFGHINGPFFVIYLLTIMESFLNLNLFISYFIIGIMIFATTTEFIWLVLTNQIFLSFVPFVEYVVRVLSIVFISAYGFVLAQKTLAEEKSRSQVQEYAGDLEKVTKSLKGVNQKLKNLDRQKDEFLTMAAHELRAPLSAIKGYLSMVLEGDTGDIPEKARGFLADANAINERLVRLINNMLNVSKIEGGLMVYQLEEENLSRVTKLVFSQFQSEAERKGLTYKIEIPFEIKDKVKVDPDRIQEVIGNLISNAVKYTDRGSVVVRLRQPVKDSVRFEVEDTGPGISEKEQARLFKKFSRAESVVGKTVGTGLGLYISKLLVQKFKGEIGVASEVDRGSTFWFELPLV